MNPLNSKSNRGGARKQRGGSNRGRGGGKGSHQDIDNNKKNPPPRLPKDTSRNSAKNLTSGSSATEQLPVGITNTSAVSSVIDPLPLGTTNTSAGSSATDRLPVGTTTNTSTASSATDPLPLGTTINTSAASSVTESFNILAKTAIASSDQLLILKKRLRHMERNNKKLTRGYPQSKIGQGVNARTNNKQRGQQQSFNASGTSNCNQTSNQAQSAALPLVPVYPAVQWQPMPLYQLPNNYQMILPAVHQSPYQPQYQSQQLPVNFHPAQTQYPPQYSIVYSHQPTLPQLPPH